MTKGIALLALMAAVPAVMYSTSRSGSSNCFVTAAGGLACESSVPVVAVVDAGNTAAAKSDKASCTSVGGCSSSGTPAAAVVEAVAACDSAAACKESACKESGTEAAKSCAAKSCSDVPACPAPAPAAVAAEACAVASACAAAPGATDCGVGGATWIAFGQPMKVPADQTVCVGTVLAEPQAFAGKTVRLSGTVSKVCKTEGCWIELDTPGAAMPLVVKFTCPVEGRLFPMEAAGRPVVVEGEVQLTEISEAAARHFAQEAGASEADVQKIVGPQKQLQLNGPAVLVNMPA